MTLQKVNDMYRIRRAIQMANSTIGSRVKIYELFIKETDKEERAKGLKSIYYTIGGVCTPFIDYDYNRKGIIVRRKDWTVIVKLTWAQLVPLIDSFLIAGTYMKARGCN